MLSWHDWEEWKSFNQFACLDTARNTWSPAPCSREVWVPPWTGAPLCWVLNRVAAEKHKENFFYLQSEWARRLCFLRGGKNKIKDLSATSQKARVLGHCAGGHIGRHSGSNVWGPTVPTARPLMLSSSTAWQRQQGLLCPPARASLVPGSS